MMEPGGQSVPTVIAAKRGGGWGVLVLWDGRELFMDIVGATDFGLEILQARQIAKGKHLAQQGSPA